MSSIEVFCDEPKVSEAKMVDLENRIAEYIKEYLRNGSVRLRPFAVQKTIIDHTP